MALSSPRKRWTLSQTWQCGEKGRMWRARWKVWIQCHHFCPDLGTCSHPAAGAARRPRQPMCQEDANRRGLDVPIDGRGGNCAQYFPAFHHSGTSFISWGHIRNQHVLLVRFLILFLSMKGSCITSLKMAKQYRLPEIDTNN